MEAFNNREKIVQYKGREIKEIRNEIKEIDVNKDIYDKSGHIKKYKDILIQYDSGKIKVNGLKDYEDYRVERRRRRKTTGQLPVEFRLKMFLALYEKMKKHKYLEYPYNDEYLEVELIDNKYYPWGEHRVAILQHLGYNSIIVKERIIVKS